jgi:hypothetical protein
MVARHAVENVELRLVLPNSATFLKVKEAIAKQVGSDDIFVKGRIVRKKGVVYSSFKDHDTIGDVREVLVLGVDLKAAQPTDHRQLKSKVEATVPDPALKPVEPAPMPIQAPRLLQLAQPKTMPNREWLASSAASVTDPAQASQHSEPSQAKGAAAPSVPTASPHEVQIFVKQAVDGMQVTLSAWTNWTFAKVKEALGQKLGRDDVKSRARLVFKAGDGIGAWVPFKDSDVLNEKREVHVLGVDLASADQVTMEGVCQQSLW